MSRLVLLLLVLLPAARAAVPGLLQEAVARLTDERQRWAFTQRVREYEGDRLVAERLERFDPTRGHERRWRLLEKDGRKPTAAEVEAWSERKNRARKRPPKAVSEYVDLEQARVREESAGRVSYDIPFRRSAGGLFPGEKVNLALTINKQTRGIERAQVSIDESFKVALGLARIIDLDLDLEMPRAAPEASDDPARPQGNASAVVNRFGRRFEYYWSDFTRHESPSAAAQSSSPRKPAAGS